MKRKEYNPAIYRITNKKTNLCYIGKTIHPFALRWNQHFSYDSDSKFCIEINKSKLTDWKFEILEEINIPSRIKTDSGIRKFILSRENYWIVCNNSILNGYNTINSSKDELHNKKTSPLSIYFDEETRIKLKKYSMLKNMSESRCVEFIVKKYLANEDKKSKS